MNWSITWKVMLSWFIVVMVILGVAGEWSVVAFGVTFGLVYGGVAYRYRKKVKPFFEKINLDNYAGFLLLAVIVTVGEEVYCYILGNQIAHPVLWVDLVLVTVMWWVWFSTWYFFLSRRYYFEEKAALMTAGFTGVLYEFVGTGEIFKNPLGIVVAVPLAVVVYAAIFALPLQLITFTGDITSRQKYVVGSVLPFLLTIPVALGLYLILAGFGIQ
ncbi:MAG: hypothetical protein HXS46_15810 [Theionarchaea archaeon]|nr:hypothetical protein [Theionarchaea archaeon]